MDFKVMEGEAFTIWAREPFVSQQGWTLIAAGKSCYGGQVVWI